MWRRRGKVWITAAGILGLLTLFMISGYIEKDHVGMTVPQLIHTLEDDDYVLRAEAAKALGSIGPEAKEAVPALAKALRDDIRLVQWHATEALISIGAQAVPALKEAMEDESETVRFSAARALESLDSLGTEAVPYFAMALKDGCGRARSRCLAGVNPVPVRLAVAG